MNLFLFAAEGGEAHAENSFLLPHDLNEVYWGTIAFVLVVGLIIWKGGPAIKGMWNGRIERLTTELDEAATARTAAEAELADVQQRIANVDSEKATILADADQAAVTLKEQTKVRTEQDRIEVGVRAGADAESSKLSATADLQSELAALAVGAAEEVVARSLDAETQNQLIETYIGNLGGAR
jgi:F-type H+-transporting ATPase subunit b